MILVAVSNLPGSDCDGIEDPGSAAEVVLSAITAVASLCCVAAAVRRVLALGRAGADLSALIAIGALAIAAIVVGGTLVEPGTSGLVWGSLLRRGRGNRAFPACSARRLAHREDARRGRAAGPGLPAGRRRLRLPGLHPARPGRQLRGPLLRLVGHKGADLIAPGNTLESFRAAVEAGVDTIEFDVLWLPDAHLPMEERAPLVVAHDWHDAERRTPLALTEALDAFLEPPLDEVEIDLDIKLPGSEEELVDALRERGLIERAMVSTMELYSLGRVLQLEPALRRGWTYPKVTKDWASKRWAKGADAGRARGHAPAATRPRRREAAEDGGRGDVGLPPSDHRPPGADHQARRRRADRLDRRRPVEDAAPGRPRRRRHLLQRPATFRRARVFEALMIGKGIAKAAVLVGMLALGLAGPASADAATEGRLTLEIDRGLQFSLNREGAKLRGLKPALGRAGVINLPVEGGGVEYSGKGRLVTAGGLQFAAKGRRATFRDLVLDTAFGTLSAKLADGGWRSPPCPG